MIYYKKSFGSGRPPESKYGCHLAYKAHYYKVNKQEILAKNKAYQDAHQEEIKEYKRLYYQQTRRLKGRYGTVNMHCNVKQYDLYTGELLGTYRSITEASEDNRIDRKTIRYAVKNNKGISPRLGWRWEVSEVNKDFEEVDHEVMHQL